MRAARLLRLNALSTLIAVSFLLASACVGDQSQGPPNDGHGLVQATPDSGHSADAGATSVDSGTSCLPHPSGLDFDSAGVMRWYGLKTKERLVIRNQQDWSDLWAAAWHSYSPDAPACVPYADLANEMVIVVALGERPGNRSLLEVAVSEDAAANVEVTVTEVFMESGCFALAVPSRHMWAMKYSNQVTSVTFVEATRTYDCK